MKTLLKLQILFLIPSHLSKLDYKGYISTDINQLVCFTFIYLHSIFFIPSHLSKLGYDGYISTDRSIDMYVLPTYIYVAWMYSSCCIIYLLELLDYMYVTYDYMYVHKQYYEFIIQI